jgi:uncharacterized membrane protein
MNTTENVKQILIVSTTILILDYIWLKFIFGKLWSDMIYKIQLKPMNINIKYAGTIYILLILAIVIFVLPKIRDEYILKDSIIYGGLLGLIIYGVFDLTNKLVFDNYSLNLAIIDIFWGTFLFTFVSYLTKKILLYTKYII